MLAFYTPWTATVWLVLAYTTSPSLALPRLGPGFGVRPEITTPPSLPATTTMSLDDAMSCQAQQVAWSSSSQDAWSAQLVWVTYQNVWSQFFTTEYGSADVYTTSDGFAHARGSFTITSASTSTSVTDYGPYSMPEFPTTEVYTVPQPSCTIDSAACASMYSSFDSKWYSSSETVWYAMALETANDYVPSATASDYTPSATVTEKDSLFAISLPYDPSAYPQWYDWPVCPRPMPIVTIPEHSLEPYSYTYSEGYTSQEVYYYPYPEPTGSCDTSSSTGGCSVTGRNVQLFYWPPTPSISMQSPRTIVTKGITMTSPSVYLSFEDLAASQTITQWENCPWRAGAWESEGSFGSVHSGSWITMAPSSVSTLEKGEWSGYWGSETMMPDAALPALHDIPQDNNSTYWWSLSSMLWNGWGTYSMVTSSLNFDHITRPDARAYYLGASRTVSEYANSGIYYILPVYGNWQMSIPLGCSSSQQYCNTIFDDLYKPQLSIPPEVLAIDPLWASCSLDQYGIYATPVALGEAPSITATASVLQVSPSARPGSVQQASGPSETVPPVAMPTVVDN